MTDTPDFLSSLFVQLPLAGAAVWVAKLYMNKHEKSQKELVDAFRQEAKACHENYDRVFTELMRTKDTIIDLFAKREDS